MLAGRPTGILSERVVVAEYFGQFGSVSKVRVSRSKRSTASKGFAFLKFQHAEVARIAAEAMNGYMMFGHTLKCSLVPSDQQHPRLFKGAGRKMRRKPWLQIEADRHNMQRTPEEQQKRMSRLAARSKRRSEKIREAGIDYEGPQVQVSGPQKLVFD
jgi:nucleolar protein 15